MLRIPLTVRRRGVSQRGIMLGARTCPVHLQRVSAAAWVNSSARWWPTAWTASIAVTVTAPGPDGGQAAVPFGPVRSQALLSRAMWANGA